MLACDSDVHQWRPDCSSKFDGSKRRRARNQSCFITFLIMMMMDHSVIIYCGPIALNSNNGNTSHTLLLVVCKKKKGDSKEIQYKSEMIHAYHVGTARHARINNNQSGCMNVIKYKMK